MTPSRGREEENPIFNHQIVTNNILSGRDPENGPTQEFLLSRLWLGLNLILVSLSGLSDVKQ